MINFKCYLTGERALRLAKVCEQVSKRYKVNIAVAPQLTDICQIARNLKMKVFAQHIDPVDAGAYTGHVTASAVKEAGANGTLINHSERRLKLKEIGKCIELARKHGLVSVVCSGSLAESRKIARFNPNFLAYEDPLLIGTGRAVSKVKPETVKRFVQMVSRINPKTIPICGAGISSGEDVKTALELGTKGVIVASAVAKSKNPKKILTEMARSAKP